MSHAEFIEQLSNYRAIAEFLAGGASLKEASGKFSMTPQRIGIARSFYNRRKDEVQCEWLGDLCNASVQATSRIINLSSLKAMRGDLIENFLYDPEGKIKRWPQHRNRVVVRRVMERSGLRWFKNKGVLYVHWSEKE